MQSQTISTQPTYEGATTNMATTKALDPAAQKAVQAEVLRTLEVLGGKLNSEDDIVFEGTQLKIPQHMTLMGAYDFIGKRVADEEQEYTVTRKFNYLPMDGARATAQAIKQLFGFTIGKAVRTFFGTRPPELREVPVDVGETEQVPWGRLGIPFVEDAYIDLGAVRDSVYGVIFVVQVTCKRRDRFKMAGLLNKIEENLKANSIYRGKAITASEEPTFIDTSGIDFEDVVYTEDVMRRLRHHIWAGIMYPQALRDAGQPTKRVVVLHGTYGTGKTLAAYLTAKLCVQASTDPNGEPVTFIMCRPGMDSWVHAMNLARLYGKCVIFIEDADLLANTGDADAVSRLLEQFDGLTAKNQEMTLVLTTNHIDKIHKGMLRPGRTDALIEIGPMDRPGVEKLARRVIGDKLDAKTEEFDAVFEAFAGFTPSYVREVFDRSVRSSIVNHQGTLGLITAQDLIDAANDLRPQLEIMEAAPERTERAGIDGAFQALIEQSVKDYTDNVVEHRLDGARLEDTAGDTEYILRTN